jgi:hypothetical protein
VKENMDLQYDQIQLEKEQDYLALLAKCPQKSSDYSFSNLFGWAEEYDLTWAWQDELVWIRQSKPVQQCWAPIGPWETVDWADVFDHKCEKGLGITRVPEKLADMWRSTVGDRIEIEEERDNWDYLYSISELVELRGNRFHKKKNLVNQFKKKYNFTYEPLGPDMIDPAMAMQADWCNWRDCESSDVLSAENRSVHKILANWEELTDLIGGVLMVDDMIVAYTIAEKLSSDTVVIHYEKGCPDFKGVYQAINQMFLEHLEGDFQWVNREQDLGEEGLRKAKLSYNPVGFLKKYRVTVK